MDIEQEPQSQTNQDLVNYNDTNQDQFSYADIGDDYETFSLEQMIEDVKESYKKQREIFTNHFFDLTEDDKNFINENLRIKEQLLFKAMVDEGLIQNQEQYFGDALSEEYLDSLHQNYLLIQKTKAETLEMLQKHKTNKKLMQLSLGEQTN